MTQAGTTLASKSDAPVITMSGIAKSFGGVVAVRDCDLQVMPGCVTGIVGPNGAGKSTIFNLITGFIVPDRGRILYRGRDIVGLGPPRIFKLGIARSFQGVRTLRNLSVMENLLLGATAADALSLVWRPAEARRRSEAAQEQAWKVLDELDLGAAGNRLAGELGYAEQKLLSIGRLMMTEADVVLLDEPLGGLDAGAIDAFIGRIRQLVSGRRRTVCIVEHNLNAVRRVADRVIFMADGTVQASGTTAEVLEREDLARLYLGVPAREAEA